MRYFHHEMVTPVHEMQWEVGIPVPKETIAKYPFEIKQIPEQLVAFTTVECTNDELEKYWQSLNYIIQSRGFFVTDGPLRIIRSGSYNKTSKNELQLPVRRKKYSSIELPSF